MIKILFPLIMAIIFAIIHYLGYKRVIKKLHISNSIKKVFFYALIFNYINVLGYLTSRYFIDIPNVLYFIFSLSIGVGFVILVSILVYEILNLFHKIPFEQSKRDFFKKSSDVGFLSMGALYLGSGIAEGSKLPVIQRVNIKQNRFKEPYRIVQISDMHIGGLIDKEFVHRSVEIINTQKADLVVITGDLIDTPIARVSKAVDELQHIKSKYGTYYILGNHEYFHGLEPTIDYIKSLGIKILNNSSERIDKFYICGVNDIFGFRYGAFEPDIDKTMKDLDAKTPTLLLAHQPRFLKYLGEHKPSLVLSGHTHGGQIWPFGYLVSIVQPFLKGLHKIGENRHIYVNSGIGFWGPKMRLGSQAEITVIEWS